MLDNLGGIRSMIERQGLPPRINVIVEQLEKQNKIKIEDVPQVGIDEVKQLFQLVDGQNLIGAIVAHIAASVPADQLPQSVDPEKLASDLTDGEVDSMLEGSPEELAALLEGCSDDTINHVLSRAIDTDASPEHMKVIQDALDEVGTN